MLINSSVKMFSCQLILHQRAFIIYLVLQLFDNRVKVNRLLVISKILIFQSGSPSQLIFSLLLLRPSLCLKLLFHRKCLNYYWAFYMNFVQLKIFSFALQNTRYNHKQELDRSCYTFFRISNSFFQLFLAFPSYFQPLLDHSSLLTVKMPLPLQLYFVTGTFIKIQNIILC